MATHSSTLAWKIPWTEEPGGRLSMGSHRVRHDWHDLAAAAGPFHLPLSALPILSLSFLACGILVPQAGIEPVPPAVEARSLNHWTARNVCPSVFSYRLFKSFSDFGY